VLSGPNWTPPPTIPFYKEMEIKWRNFVLRDVTLCSLVDVYRRLGGTVCFNL
jgi:hypothetical protein